MRVFKRVILGLSGLLIAMMCLAFVLENQQSVELSFITWSAPRLPVSFWVMASLLAGMIIGPVLGFFVGRKKAEI